MHNDQVLHWDMLMFAKYSAPKLKYAFILAAMLDLTSIIKRILFLRKYFPPATRL